MNSEPEFDARMKRMAEEHQAVLPSPELIWWRAQILKKQEQKQRMERPVLVMRLIAALVCLEVFAAGWATYGQHVPALEGAGWLLLPLGAVVLTASLVSAVLLWSTATGR